MNLWQAPAAPCPNCGTMTPSDVVDRKWAMTQRTIDMTYTCRTCGKLFVARVSTHTEAKPTILAREP